MLKRPEQELTPEETRAGFIQGLRDLADFLTAFPLVPVSPHRLNEFVDTREEFDAIHEAVPMRAVSTDEFYVLRRTFGKVITLEINHERPKEESDVDETPDPATHAFVASTDFSDCCKLCGEAESVHGHAFGKSR